MNRGGGCSQRTPPPGTHFVALRGFSQELRRLFSPPSASAQRRFRCSQHRRVRMWTDQRESQTVLDHFDPPSWSPHPHPRHSSLLFCEASGAVFSSFCLNCLLQKLWMGSTWGPTALAVCLEYSLCFEGRVVDPDSSASFFFFFFHEAGMKSHLLSQLCPQQGLKGSFCCSRKKKEALTEGELLCKYRVRERAWLCQLHLQSTQNICGPISQRLHQPHDRRFC